MCLVGGRCVKNLKSPYFHRELAMLNNWGEKKLVAGITFIDEDMKLF